jgi:hypothetical protein
MGEQQSDPMEVDDVLAGLKRGAAAEHLIMRKQEQVDLVGICAGE